MTQSTLTFPLSLGASPIAISPLARSSNSVFRLPSPDAPKFRHTSELTIQCLSSIGISEFAGSRIQMHISRHFSLRNPDVSCHLSSTNSAVAHTNSTSRRDIACHGFVIPVAKSWSFPHEIPIGDFAINPTLLTGLDQRLSFFSLLASSRLGVPNAWVLTLRTSEFARSSDLCHLSSSDG
jgi:hypothetical protein